MAIRNGLFGLAGVVVAAGAAAAGPPAPHVDGRVADPVAQEFYQPEVVTAGYRPAPVAPPRSVPETVGRAAAGMATAAPAGGAGRAMGTSVVRPGTGRPVADVADGVPGSILDHTVVPLGTVPVDD